MISYEQVMELTRKTSGAAAFEDPCCELMYKTVASLAPGSTIVEVGVEFGRSTSILAQVAKDQGHRLILIDPFVDPVSGVKAMEMLTAVGVEFVLYKMTTAQAAEAGLVWTFDQIGLLHIDGDHTWEGVNIDCQLLLDEVAIGGYACFHDYGRDSLPDVYAAASKYMTEPQWEAVGHANTLGVWRRK